MSTLSLYFNGIAYKRLSAVETNPAKSNQHELNGTLPLINLLGRVQGKKQISCTFLYFGDGDGAFISFDGSITWYNAREKHLTRNEYRLYYPTNPVMIKAEEGDSIIIAQKKDENILVIVTCAQSGAEQQMSWLFGAFTDSHDFQFTEISERNDKSVGFAERTILEYLGIEVFLEDTRYDWLGIIFSEFGEKFPSTTEFSIFARNTVNGISATDDPDNAIIAWINHEEMLFRTLERHIVQKKIDAGFTDVDDFISYSLSVQNKRKSRVGFSLEHHLAEVFQLHNIQFTRGGRTENNSKPDFLFPSADKYHNPGFPVNLLTVLGAKSTCKDRWRQVLSEAKRVQEKHLFTLEPGISQNQTTEMRDSGLQLVLPKVLHSTFNPEQQKWLMNLQEFIALVKEKALVISS